jgi:hypothetical protein
MKRLVSILILLTCLCAAANVIVVRQGIGKVMYSGWTDPNLGDAVSIWHFQGTNNFTVTSGTVLDSTGHGLTGTSSNGPLFIAPFSGTNGYVSLRMSDYDWLDFLNAIHADSTNVLNHGSSDYSMSVWFRRRNNPALTTQSTSIGMKYVNTTNYWAAYANQDGGFLQNANNAAADLITSYVDDPISNWNHLALTWDADNTNACKIYINGLSTNNACAVATNANPYGDAFAVIGAISTNATSCSDLYRLAFYTNVLLTEAEIADQISHSGPYGDEILPSVSRTIWDDSTTSTKMLVFFGQSNCRGSADEMVAFGTDGVGASVMWYVDDPSPFHVQPYTNFGVSAEWPFAVRYLEPNAGYPVCIYKYGIDSMSLYWDFNPTNDTGLFPALSNGLIEAMTFASNMLRMNCTIGGVVWEGGEGEATNSVECDLVDQYIPLFMDAFRSAFDGGDTNIPFVICALPTACTRTYAENVRISESNCVANYTNAWYVVTDGDDATWDGTHWTSTQMVNVAGCLWSNWYTLQYP